MSRSSRGSRSFRGTPRDFRRSGRGNQAESFRCGHCDAFVGPVLYGGSHRNHCPYCLYSRHVDERVSGDRASRCGGLMEPIGAFTRPKGEHVIVHHCLTCGFERHNRIAGDDDFELVLKLPVVPAPLDSPKAARASSSAQMHDAGPATDSGEPRSERHEGPHDD